MERYYKILGISNNASKEEIKRAYHEKMKALHPDKVHGTPLEDTATFFSTEINEAYNNLISQFNKGHTPSNQKSQAEYIEEEIFIKSIGNLKYILSNDLGLIINTITKKTGLSFPDTINEIQWMLNPVLSENVKYSMTKQNMNYSMAIYSEGSIKRIIINRKNGDNWYIAAYEINTKYTEKTTSTRYNNINDEQYRTNPDISSEKSSSKTGFFIGILNLLHLIIVYMNKQNINLPEDEKTTIIFAWAIITLVVAITGFFLSKKGYAEEQKNTGYGIAGMASNGLVILLVLWTKIFTSSLLIIQMEF
jgi:hypothetical protein